LLEVMSATFVGVVSIYVLNRPGFAGGSNS
jgi:hypothetical protein